VSQLDQVAIDVEKTQLFAYQYTVATLVSHATEYQEMLSSFSQAGFDRDKTEFLFINNASGNRYDAYQGLNKFITSAQGKYIILCHQDILLSNDREPKLAQCIQAVTEQDPHWGVLGNAGGYNKPHVRYRHIIDPVGKSIIKKGLPISVRSLDENFLVLRAEANLGFSEDLSGFHMYGTDICLQAEFKGCRAYVIDFLLTHKSSGKRGQDFYKDKKAFIKKYTSAFKGRFIATTCTYFYLSGTRWLTHMFQSKYIDKQIRRWVKRFARWFV